MAYCSKCGREIPYDAVYCPNCGAQAKATYEARPANEFERLTQDRAVQEHWFARVAAFVIDTIIFAIGFAIIAVVIWFSVGLPSVLFGANTGSAAIASFPFNPLGLLPIGWLWGVLFVLYFVLAESWYGRTIGKSVMRLHVVNADGSPADFGQSFVRNISKINWLLLLLDIGVGLFTHTQPGQKFSDHFVGTIVAKEHSP